MDYDVNFKCVLDTGEEMPKEAVERAGIKFPDVHKMLRIWRYFLRV